MKEKIIYTNELGQSLEISHFSTFFLEGVEGLGAIQNNFYTQKSPNQDGVTIVNHNLEPRDIKIRGTINSIKKDRILKYRRELIKVFNPKLDGTFRYELGDFVAEIDCKVEFAPIFPSNKKRFKEFYINLYCPDPFFKDDFDISEEVITWIGGMTFPLQLPTRFATAGEKIINAINDGDVSTPIKMEIYGPATNPKIEKRATGEFIRIKGVLTSDDVVTITTEFGNKRVELNGVNAFNLLDLPDSKFFDLDIGDNVIEMTTEDVSNSANVKITYRNKYLGI